MTPSAPSVLADALWRRGVSAAAVRRVLAVAALVACGMLSAQPPDAVRAPSADATALPSPPASGQVPSAVWRPPGHVFAVELAADPSLGAVQLPAVQHYAIGVVALPVSVLQPQVAFALPFYLLFAAPWQAVFNARADVLARGLVAQPLPDAVMQALRAQWPTPSAATPTPSPALQVTLRLAGYGLAARSGRKLEAFDSAEDLCLVANGVLELSREGSAPAAELIDIGPRSTTRDAPPPLCAPLSRWAADDGLLLRRATREMAELLAAFMVDRARHLP